MKMERGQKNRLMQKLLQGVRKAAINGAGRPSHKGIFEPKVPESAKKSGGVPENEINNNWLQIYAIISVVFLVGIRSGICILR